ncbi:hypothetical protein [Actinomyces bowdenii]|uniref:ABC transporter n=1 Tax=Actinomyces bowdenii TaxID=131109 RepID=A0A853EIZ3_9ACTO|nr:hypothetical protein [Actinomyces bowdenii]MBF0697164.1 hypothetical protein [Actinomyces bowdenii]NYS69337.1 hypothetical protein [Actinomyces bowdenii]
MLRLLHRLRAPLAACALAPLALTACGAPAAPSATAESPTAQATTAFSPSPGAHGNDDGAGGHGHVEGAEELEEAPTSLAVLSATGELSLIGLEDLSITPVTRVEGATTAATDRRLLAMGGAGGRVSLADSGVWTQDHGDHQHYYRAPATALGSLAAPAGSGSGAPEAVSADEAPPTIASSAQYTVVTASGRMTLLDRRALEQGRVSPVMTAEVDPGSYAAPLGSHVVAVHQGQALLLDEQGTAVGDPLPCPRPSGGISTRAGAALGCEGGAVVVSLPDPQAQTPVLEWVALPETAPQGTSLVSFGARPGRPKVAALDSHGGWWSLSIRERSWSGPQADPADTTGPGAGAPLVAVCALGDTHDRVVGVDDQGRIHVWADGAEEAVTDPIASPDLVARSGIHATADRAYLPTASGEEILEIDPRAQAGVERTIPAPGLLTFQMVGA